MIDFRSPVPSDLHAIVGTYNATIPSRMVTADLEAVTPESKKAWFEGHTQNKRPLWVALKDGEYAGWMSFNSFYGRPAYDGTVEVSIYLEESFRGMGIGKACLAKAIKAAPGLKVHTLLGFIFGHNEPSIELFKKFGFEKWAHLPGVADMDGVMRDLLIWGLKI